MKALTNILTHTLLMLLLLMLATCTEETAEVDNLSRQEQYVSVRMNIPGMTAATTRAEDGVIETIHALAFNADKELLATRTATDINNANNNNGFNGTFNIIVPNGTETIHFLANVGDYDFSSVKQESDLSNLSIGDWNMLRYWGKTTTSDGNTTLNVTLYRNLAKISIMPSITDTEFNQFTQDQLKMTGFYNANERGALVPCEDGEFNFDDNSEYCTMPQDLTSDNYQLYSFTTMTAFEHENTDANPTYIICRIGDYHYKVALADDEGNRYPIIRNHHYIIYVSDVDDYAHDDNYRADTYEKAFEKLPINLEVVEAMYVDFQYDNSQALQLDNTFTVTMTVPEGGTLTDFSITAEGFTFDQPASSYSTGTYTFTFTPTGVGSKTITFTGTGSENLNNVNTTIDVNVTASITANATTSTTLYYDSDDAQTVTVQVTVPAGVETLNIGGAENFTIAKTAGDGTLNGTTYTMGSERTATFTFTLNAQNVTNQQVFTFSGDNVTADSVIINMVQTPTVAFSPTNDQTIYLGGDPLTVTMTVPNGGTLNTLSIKATGFTINNTYSDSYTDETDRTGYTTVQYTFTPTGTEAANRQITFTGSGTNIKEVNRTINVAVVKPAITASADKTTLYYDKDNQTTTVNVKIPRGVSALNIEATDFTVTQYNNNVGNYNNGVYTLNNTYSEQNIQFVFTMKNVSSDSGKTSTTIEFSDISDIATSPDPITITLTEEPEEVSSLVVTPVGTTTIDLSEGGNKTVKLTITLPSKAVSEENGQISGQIEMLANNIFNITRTDEGKTQPQFNNGNYYYYNLDATTINIELALSNSLYFDVACDYSITFNYNANGSTESVSTTITVVNDELPEFVIWNGSKEMTSAGYVLNYKSFEEYRNSGKQLKIDIEQTGNSWKQFYVRYDGDYEGNLLNGTYQGQTIDSTFSLEIPSEDRNLKISGEGGIIITKIYVE